MSDSEEDVVETEEVEEIDVIDDTDPVDIVAEEKEIDVDNEDVENSDNDEDDTVVAINPQYIEKNEDYTNTNYYRIIKIVPDDERKTSSIMTMYEYCEVIGIRTAQIDKSGIVFTDTKSQNSRDMAIEELHNRCCPLKIIRHMGNNTQEHWSCNDMGFPTDIRPIF